MSTQCLAQVAMNYLDVAVSCASIVEVIIYWGLNSQMAVNPMWLGIKTLENSWLRLFRLLRIGKLARAIRMVAMNTVFPGLWI